MYLRMDDFQPSCFFIDIIQKQFATAGLNDICTEPSLNAITLVESMMGCRKYNRKIRALKIVCEVLQLYVKYCNN